MIWVLESFSCERTDLLGAWPDLKPAADAFLAARHEPPAARGDQAEGWTLTSFGGDGRPRKKLMIYREAHYGMSAGQVGVPLDMQGARFYWDFPVVDPMTFAW